MSAVFEGAGGGGLGAIGSARPDYLEYHAWRLNSDTAPERRAGPRNVLKTYDREGNVLYDHVVIHDTMNTDLSDHDHDDHRVVSSSDDCLSLNLASYEAGGAERIDWDLGCSRPNSSAVAGKSLQGGRRSSDVGAADPAEVEVVLTEATIGGAVGNRQPEAPGGNFWLELDTFNIRCHGGFYSEVDLPLLAAETIDAYEVEYDWAWREYLRVSDLYAIGLATEDERAERYLYASDIRGMLEGWRVIHAYRELVHGELLEAVRTAGYVYAGGGGGLAVDFDGVGCEAVLVTLQPFRRQSGGGVDVAPPNAGGAHRGHGAEQLEGGAQHGAVHRRAGSGRSSALHR